MVYCHSFIEMTVHVAKMLMKTCQPKQNNVMHVKLKGSQNCILYNEATYMTMIKIVQFPFNSRCND